MNYISRIISSLNVIISIQCLTGPMDKVILIQTVRQTFGAVLKWNFNKLPASNVI